MEAGEVARLVALLDSRGVEVWVDGGWGVDALLREQVREHDDLDLVALRNQMPELTEALRSAGYEHVAGGSPMSAVFVDVHGRQVDVHPVLFDQARGGGVYVMEDGDEWVYPDYAFTGEGVVGGRPVRCLSPEAQVLVHDGYELTDKDYCELDLLHERFGVTIPSRRTAGE
jgi:lincosamide nucleotidyltransferase A/C/D/E